jgi:hypothetical protein
MDNSEKYMKLDALKQLQDIPDQTRQANSALDAARDQRNKVFNSILDQYTPRK